MSKFNNILEEYLKTLTLEKEDQNKDGKNNYKDVLIARMVASGMSKEEAIAKVEKKNIDSKEDEEDKED
jgi:hypothetical protein